MADGVAEASAREQREVAKGCVGSAADDPGGRRVTAEEIRGRFIESRQPWPESEGDGDIRGLFIGNS